MQAGCIPFSNAEPNDQKSILYCQHREILSYDRLIKDKDEMTDTETHRERESQQKKEPAEQQTPETDSK